MPGGIPADLQPAVAAARSLRTVETFEITLSADSAYSDPNGFLDFSHAGMEKRRDVGRTIAFSQLSPFFNGQRAA